MTATTRHPMPKRTLPRPTDAELSILNVLWERGASTVRQIQERLGEDTGYTTVLKFLQIMTEKGLVTRDESQHAHIYQPRLSKADTQRQLIDDLLDRAFGGSASKLVVQALSTQKATAQEIAEIRKIIEKLERNAP